MPVQMTLNIVTQVLCIITLALAITALLPQIKLGLVFLRDLVLWALLFGFLAMVGFFGWIRLHEIRTGERQVASPVLEIPRIPDEALNETLTSKPSQVEQLSTEPYVPPLDITKTTTQRLRSNPRSNPQLENSFRANRSANAMRHETSTRGRAAYRSDSQRIRPVRYDMRYVDRRITSR